MLARPGSVGVRPGEDVGAAKGCRREGTETGTGREGRRDGCGSDLVMNQLALSDRILLNKSDLISDAEVGFRLDFAASRISYPSLVVPLGLPCLDLPDVMFCVVYVHMYVCIP